MGGLLTPKPAPDFGDSPPAPDAGPDASGGAEGAATDAAIEEQAQREYEDFIREQLEEQWLAAETDAANYTEIGLWFGGCAAVTAPVPGAGYAFGLLAAGTGFAAWDATGDAQTARAALDAHDAAVAKRRAAAGSD